MWPWMYSSCSEQAAKHQCSRANAAQYINILTIIVRYKCRQGCMVYNYCQAITQKLGAFSREMHHLLYCGLKSTERGIFFTEIEFQINVVLFWVYFYDSHMYHKLSGKRRLNINRAYLYIFICSAVGGHYITILAFSDRNQLACEFCMGQYSTGWSLHVIRFICCS